MFNSKGKYKKRLLKMSKDELVSEYETAFEVGTNLREPEIFEAKKEFIINQLLENYG